MSKIAHSAGRSLVYPNETKRAQVNHKGELLLDNITFSLLPKDQRVLTDIRPKSNGPLVRWGISTGHFKLTYDAFMASEGLFLLIEIASNYRDTRNIEFTALLSGVNIKGKPNITDGRLTCDKRALLDFSGCDTKLKSAKKDTDKTITLELKLSLPPAGLRVVSCLVMPVRRVRSIDAIEKLDEVDATWQKMLRSSAKFHLPDNLMQDGATHALEIIAASVSKDWIAGGQFDEELTTTDEVKMLRALDLFGMRSLSENCFDLALKSRGSVPPPFEGEPDARGYITTPFDSPERAPTPYDFSALYDAILRRLDCGVSLGWFQKRRKAIGEAAKWLERSIKKTGVLPAALTGDVLSSSFKIDAAAHTALKLMVQLAKRADWPRTSALNDLAKKYALAIKKTWGKSPRAQAEPLSTMTSLLRSAGQIESCAFSPAEELRESAKLLLGIRRALLFENNSENTLHIFEGVPASWLARGGVTKFERAPITGGTASATLHTILGGRRAVVDVSVRSTRGAFKPPTKCVLYLPRGKATSVKLNGKKTRAKKYDEGIRLEFKAAPRSEIIVEL